MEKYMEREKKRQPQKKRGICSFVRIYPFRNKQVETKTEKCREKKEENMSDTILFCNCNHVRIYNACNRQPDNTSQ